jgi:Secretion system C-terminal sorting domain
MNENNYLNSYYLFQNYPNPFNPSTRISYYVGEPGLVQLKVYNILGVEAATLVNDYKNSGNYSVDFDAAKLSSGVYFYSLSVNNFTQTRKMILEK